MEYTAIIEKCEEGGYVAQCAELSNAFAQGETIEEVNANLREVINLLMECEKEEQLKRMRGKKFVSRRLVAV